MVVGFCVDEFGVGHFGLCFWFVVLDAGEWMDDFGYRYCMFVWFDLYGLNGEGRFSLYAEVTGPLGRLPSRLRSHRRLTWTLLEGSRPGK